MNVILLENISKLGRLGETVKVKAGFGRNYLIPQGKAVHATEANTASFEARRAELEAAADAQMAEAQLRADAINALGTITITANAGEEGKLFGSVGTRDIADAIVALGCEVAFFDKTIYLKDDIAKVATLPSLEEIRGKIVGLISAPASQLVRLLLRPDQDIISILNNKKD